MSGNRKQRKRKRKKGERPNYNQGLAKGTWFIDQDLIALCRRLGIRVRKSLFGPGGYRCVRCGFGTVKRGTAGRNAMRAHHKGHLNEDKAGRRLKRSVIITIGLVVTALLWRTVDEYLGTAVSIWMGKLEPETLIGAVYAGVQILTLLWVYVSATVLYYRINRRNRMLFYSSLTASFGLTALVVIAEYWIAGIRVNPLWYLFALLPLLMVATVSRSLGQRNLRYRRRRLPPANYIPVYKALTEVGDDAAEDIRHKISTLIRKNRLKVNRLNHREKLAIATLGIRISDLKTRKTGSRG